METLHFMIAELRPDISIIARRIGVALLLLIAGMVVVQPSAGQSATWTATGNLKTARHQHTATLLPNGKVLVAGGFLQNGATRTLSSAELYNPATGTWARTGSLITPRGW